MSEEILRAPCGCEKRRPPGPILEFTLYCDAHFAQCEASTPITNIYGEQATPCHFEAIDAVQAGLRAIAKWSQP